MDGGIRMNGVAEHLTSIMSPYPKNGAFTGTSLWGCIENELKGKELPCPVNSSEDPLP